MSVLIGALAFLIQGAFLLKSKNVVASGMGQQKEKRDQLEKMRVQILKIFDSKPENISKDALSKWEEL